MDQGSPEWGAMNIRMFAAAALKRAQEATPGPWSVDPIDGVYVRHGKHGELGPTIRALNKGDAPFIAAARFDVPVLAEEVLRLTGDGMRDQVETALLRAMIPQLNGVLDEEDAGYLLFKLLDAVMGLLNADVDSDA